MIKFITDIQNNEPDILTPVRFKDLIIKDLDGKNIKMINVPDGGWTHDLLQDTVEQLIKVTVFGADAYLGREWVGSTEV